MIHTNLETLILYLAQIKASQFKFYHQRVYANFVVSQAFIQRLLILHLLIKKRFRFVRIAFAIRES